jgi:putative membrane protein
MTGLNSMATVVAAGFILTAGTLLEGRVQARRADARLFIGDLTVAGLAEVQLGQLASERAASPDVKAFGQVMVKDHSEANGELSKLASQMKIEPPKEADKAHKELASRLSTLDGAEFDRAYIAAMVQGHRDVADRLRTWLKESRPLGEPPAGDPKAKDAAGGGPQEEALTAWAKKTLPVVEKHLERAQDLQGKLKDRKQ